MRHVHAEAYQARDNGGMRHEALVAEIEASLEDVRFALQGDPEVVYLGGRSQGLTASGAESQALLTLELDKRAGLKVKAPSGDRKLRCAACFPNGYALVESENRTQGLRIKQDQMYETLSSLLRSNVEGYEKAFQVVFTFLSECASSLHPYFRKTLQPNSMFLQLNIKATKIQARTTSLIRILFFSANFFHLGMLKNSLNAAKKRFHGHA